MSFHAYMLRCADGSYYVGHTDDLDARIGAHHSGQIPGYTQKRRPLSLVWSQDFHSREEALAAERQIKGWSRAKKEALVRGDWEAVQLLSRKLFLRYAASTGSAATQDERGRGRLHRPFVLSRGLSEAEGPVSKDKGPIIVLVRPQLGQNIGKAARAMLNFGLTEMRLVAPRDGWPNPDAGPAASGADVVLEKAKVYATTAEAIADCAQVFASTVRRRDLVVPVVGPEAMARGIRSTEGRSAILFGPERSGLETEDVALANCIVTVPINPDFGSLNLAQAVILLAYEWSRGADLVQPTVKELEPPAPMGELEGLIGQLDAALEKADYFFPPERIEATKTTLRTILTKPQWSSREIQALRGVIRSLSKGHSSKK
ncbi:MAG: TrmH family RNA methyltransferase [Sphingomicrobium sp.]